MVIVMMSISKKRKLILVCICFVIVIFARHIYNKSKIFYHADYSRIDISDIIRSGDITDEKYMLIFEQTGISPVATKELIEKGKFSLLETLNKLYFNMPETKVTYIAYPITIEENNKTQRTPFVNLKKGDILISFNTHTFDWRHGHCAMVLDAEKDILLEHISVGNTSCTTNTASWGRYPGFLVLRHSDENVGVAAAEYANNKLVGVKYNIFAGMLKKDKSVDEVVDASHCSHIIWQAYKAVGVDLDYNGGRIVTPRDISKSDILKVVQIYGINPRDYVSRIMK